MEVLRTTTTGRPRFIPTEPPSSATSTMTRSTISHHQQHQQQLALNHSNNSNGQSSPPSSGGGAADTSIRDKTRLLQLAEKVHTRKSAASPHYAKSFRAITSVVSKSAGSNQSANNEQVLNTPTVRRTNSTMLSSSSLSAPPNASMTRSKMENYKNPKLYASFSSKSSSKLTKALIKSDPAKTNIEHLVNYKKPKSPPRGNDSSHNHSVNGISVNGKRSPSENGDHSGHHHHHNSGGGGLSSFITPLKALHASFHERSSKLGQTRSKLFSHHHRDISSSNAKLLFGTTETLHSSGGSGSCSSSSAEDILTTEIAPSSKNNVASNNRSNPPDAKQRRAIINNNKNVATSSLFSSATLRRQQQTTRNGSSKVPPDFLEGFRNENSSNRSSNNDKTNNRHHHATSHEINGSDLITDSTSGRNGHEQEISNASSITANNSFITPDILGGCLDVSTTKPALPPRNGNNNGRYRIGDQNDIKLVEEPRQVNGTGCSNSAIPVNGRSMGTSNNGRIPQVTLQQQLSNGNNSNNEDISQKRKNIVVRMSYHNDEDTSGYNDLYRVLSNADSSTINENGREFVVDDVDNEVDIWPTSPITVSTVTPKSMQAAFVTTRNDSNVGSTTSLSLSSPREAQVITLTTNNYCGEDVPSNTSTNGTTAATTPSLANDNNNASNNIVSNSLFAGNSLSTFRSPRNNINGSTNNNDTAGGGIAVHQHNHHPRPASSLSTVSNSSVLKTAEDKIRNLQLSHTRDHQQQPNINSSGNNSNSSSNVRGHHLVSRSPHLQPQEHPKKSNKTQSHSPEATGSPTWLEVKNSSSSSSAAVPLLSSETNCIENDINGKISYLTGSKQMLKKAVSSPVEANHGDNSKSCSRALPKLNSANKTNVVSRCKKNEGDDPDKDNSITCSNIHGEMDADDEFSMILSSRCDDSEEARGRSARRGMLMEAETSFAHQRSRLGGGRPQTALLSDEYAQYLGYDYDNNDNVDKKVQQQVAQARLHALQLGSTNGGSKCTPSPLCIEEDGESDDVFGELENKAMMVAIMRGLPAGRYEDTGKNRTGIVGIMKPQQGKRSHENGRMITHSVSFRGTTDSYSSPSTDRQNLRRLYHLCEESDGNNGTFHGKGSRVRFGQSESFNKFDRKRSRSLPKSFMSVRNGLRNVLPSQWVRDGAFERLNDCENPSHPAEKTTATNENEQGDVESSAADVEAIKMRWHKLGGGSSSSSFSDRRPKSFDYAQRKAWMKLYRDMEVSQANVSSSPAPRIARPLSKGSITHLHLQETPLEQSSSSSNLDGGASDSCRCDYEGDVASISTMMRSSDISSTSPSLFKRFSKTFSLRFGSGSNVSKQGTGEVHRKSKSKGAVGSSPDLFNRLEVDGSRDKVNGKMRKSNVKSVRGDKCQSGDSGIGMDEQSEPRHASNLRRIRSDYISPSSAIGLPPAASSTAYYNRVLANGSTSTLTKLSLVHIPDDSWDENNCSPTEGSGTSDTASYEDAVDAKLDGDDGFSSSDEGHQVEKPTYYHSLPHRKHNKRRLTETDSSNSCGDAPQEDNSIRGKVVREIIHTEQNYVKTLNDIVQGFLNPCRARNDLFSSRTVQNIFSNIEEILRLHVKFLEALKSKVEPSFVSKSNVGGVFTSWADRFSFYSEYCCNNPISVATVRSLVQFPQYAEFFEACRRLQMMDKLPLHGFLLRPIQRICQYHLQLNELLKHTEESHTDYKSVVEALETMKSVATKINDTQRQFESLQEIIRFQNSIDGWEGPNLVDRNAVILRKGELVKTTYGRKQKEVFVAILNKDLIYCKKDFMKKSGYVFDGRIDLKLWVNIDSNEEDQFFGMVHNSWRIYSPERRAWILFTAPSPTEKRKWISALEKTKEDVFVDTKLLEMAVVTSALADSEMISNGNPHGHHSNTLPKSSKKSKAKHLSVTKVDPDAMLIEVGKLKRSTIYASSTSQREGTSKFYV